MFASKLKEALAEKGFDPNLGARPLKRVIQRLILDPLSLKIITGEIHEGDKVFCDFKKGAVTFQTPRLLGAKHIKRAEKALAK